MSVLQATILLVGIFGIPAALLMTGQRFRRLKHRMRGAFWGGVISYALGVILWGVAAIAPAQMWAQESIRIIVVVIVLALFGIGGLAVGALIGNKPKEIRQR